MPTSRVDLLQGTLDVLILKALSWGPHHGHAVAALIRDSTDGAFDILDGSLYAALHRIEERGWVEAEWSLSDKGKRAKFYRLTAAGRARTARQRHGCPRAGRALHAAHAAPLAGVKRCGATDWAE